MVNDNVDYPVTFDAEYPESPSRILALLGAIFWIKGLLLIPHVIILIFLTILALVLIWIAHWAILFTGRYPESLFNFATGVQRWMTRTDSWMYGITDRYPPFSLSQRDYPTSFEVRIPDTSSRGLAVLGIIILGKLALLVPQIIILWALSYATLAASYISYWAVLFTGRYPPGPLRGRYRHPAMVVPRLLVGLRLLGQLSALQYEVADGRRSCATANRGFAVVFGPGR